MNISYQVSKHKVITKPTCHSSTHNVAHTGVPVPQAENEALFGVAEPLADDGDHRRPPGGLRHTGGHLQHHKVPQRVNLEELGHAKGDADGAADHQPDGKEDAQVAALSNVTGAEHAKGVEEEVAAVHDAQQLLAVLLVEGRPATFGVIAQQTVNGSRGRRGGAVFVQLRLHNRQRPTGRVVRRVDDEGQCQHHPSVEGQLGGGVPAAGADHRPQNLGAQTFVHFCNGDFLELMS